MSDLDKPITEEELEFILNKSLEEPNLSLTKGDALDIIAQISGNPEAIYSQLPFKKMKSDDFESMLINTYQNLTQNVLNNSTEFELDYNDGKFLIRIKKIKQEIGDRHVSELNSYCFKELSKQSSDYLKDGSIALAYGIKQKQILFAMVIENKFLWKNKTHFKQKNRIPKFIKTKEIEPQFENSFSYEFRFFIEHNEKRDKIHYSPSTAKNEVSFNKPDKALEFLIQNKESETVNTIIETIQAITPTIDTYLKQTNANYDSLHF